MSVPCFTAEGSLYTTKQAYRQLGARYSRGTAAIVAAAEPLEIACTCNRDACVCCWREGDVINCEIAF